MHRFKTRSERGAAALEFALILPILITLIFGIIEFGRAFNASITVTQAAREAVRQVALNKGSAAAVTAGTNAANPLTVTVTPLVPSSGPCTAGTNAKATVNTVFSYDIPFVSSATITISRSAVMKCGG